MFLERRTCKAFFKIYDTEVDFLTLILSCYCIRHNSQKISDEFNFENKTISENKTVRNVYKIVKQCW